MATQNPEITFDFDTDPEKRDQVVSEFKRLQKQAKEMKQVTECDHECPRCNGTGEIASTELYRGRRESIWLTCTKCQGTGTV